MRRFRSVMTTRIRSAAMMPSFPHMPFFSPPRTDTIFARPGDPFRFSSTKDTTLLAHDDGTPHVTVLHRYDLASQSYRTHAERSLGSIFPSCGGRLPRYQARRCTPACAHGLGQVCLPALSRRKWTSRCLAGAAAAHPALFIGPMTNIRVR